MTFTVNQKVKVVSEHSSLFDMTGVVSAKHDVYGYTVVMDDIEGDGLWFSDQELEAA